MDATQGSRPDAYLYTFISGPNNTQLAARLPLSKTPDGRVMAVEGKSHLSSASPWELVGEFTEHCPTNVARSIEHRNVTHKDKSISIPESKCTLPKMQNLEVLDDSSLLFTGERSHIILKHPNKAGEDGPFSYPEVSIDLSALATANFDKNFVFNNDYGVSLSYNREKNVVYVGFEDRVFLLDLEELKKHGSQERIELKPQSMDDLVKSGSAFQPLLTSAGTPSQLIKGNSICSMATLRHDPETAYLFVSSTAKAVADSEIPLKMAELSRDGRTVLCWKDAPFNKGLQYARLVEDLQDSGLKADISTLAAGTDANGDPALMIHAHHNHPVVVTMPYLQSMDTEETLGELESRKQDLETDKERSDFAVRNMGPDDINEMVHASSEGTVTPAGADPQKFKIYRLENHVIGDDFGDIKPNCHSLVECVTSRAMQNKRPKDWLRTEQALIYNGNLVSLPWRDDVSLKIMAHPLPIDAALKDCRWFSQPKATWYKVGETLDTENRPEITVYDCTMPGYESPYHVYVPFFGPDSASEISQGGALHCSGYSLVEVNYGGGKKAATTTPGLPQD
ncbi:MAG: hypothetical protein ACR2PT_10230 [Endozoicomonas sp.]